MLILFTLRPHLSAVKIRLIPPEQTREQRVDDDVEDESHNRAADAALSLRHGGRGVAMVEVGEVRLGRVGSKKGRDGVER